MLPTGTQVFDDGSTLVTAGGAVVGGTDINGRPFLPANSSIVDQASALFNYGARAWLDSRLGAKNASAASPAASVAAKPLAAQLVPILIIAGLGFLAIRALK